jgi:hypothetical protein
MPLATSSFPDAVHGLFEIPSEDARRILPARVEPLEIHHGSCLLSVSAFDFSDSPCGAYAELALSIIVAPRISGPEDRWPRGAYFTFLMAANVPAARAQGDALPLPYWREDADIRFAIDGDSAQVRVVADGASVIDMRIREHSWKPAHHDYQCFLARDGRIFLGHLDVEGEESEHEDGKGRLVLVAHPMLEGLDIASIDETPVRETWVRRGRQTLIELKPI